ncbi:MAG: capsule biosynthesis protein CapA, partial [Pseudomonadota bacterium]
MRVAGARTCRLGFNSADRTFWHGPTDYIPYRDTANAFPDTLRSIIAERGVTDLVCYGSKRPVHAAALAVASETGLTPHVFEEGYLRPYWITYERGGANADSLATKYTLNEMSATIATGAHAMLEAPDRWGDMRAHMFWGAAYHARLLAGNRGYPGFRPHRTPD